VYLNKQKPGRINIMRIAINTPVRNIQTSEISFPITAVVSKLEAEPEPLLWKMSADEVSPKSSLVERVISVVFVLMACGNSLTAP
jgi:hypothetical protein